MIEDHNITFIKIVMRKLREVLKKRGTNVKENEVVVEHEIKWEMTAAFNGEFYAGVQKTNSLVTTVHFFEHKFHNLPIQIAQDLFIYIMQIVEEALLNTKNFNLSELSIQERRKLILDANFRRILLAPHL